MRAVIYFILIIAAFTGCAPGSIYREVAIDDSENTSVILDAKQRAIISMKRSEDSTRDGAQPKSQRTVVCSEPSPDSFTAVSQSLSQSGSFSSLNKEASLALSLAMAESAGEIHRAKTIQLLRDGLYSSCMGYANGLSAHQDNSVLNRYLDATIVLFAIEQITPQPLPASTTLTSDSATLKKEQAKPEPPSDKTKKQGTESDGAPSKMSLMDRGTIWEVSSGQATAPIAKPIQDTSRGSGQDDSKSTQKEKPDLPPNTQALPPPTDSVVKAVQYLTSVYMDNTLASECFDILLMREREVETVEEVRKTEAGEVKRLKTNKNQLDVLTNACRDFLQTLPDRGTRAVLSETPSTPARPPGGNSSGDDSSESFQNQGFQNQRKRSVPMPFQ